MRSSYWGAAEKPMGANIFQDYFFSEYERVKDDCGSLIRFSAKYYSEFFLPVEELISPTEKTGPLTLSEDLSDPSHP